MKRKSLDIPSTISLSMLETIIEGNAAQARRRQYMNFLRSKARNPSTNRKAQAKRRLSRRKHHRERKV